MNPVAVCRSSVSPALSTISPIFPATRSPFRWTAMTAASYTVRKFASRMLRLTRGEESETTASTSR
jgi:hypothetical protein